MDKKKIIFSSGGTGGHIFPTISSIKYFQKKNFDTVLVTDDRAKKYLNTDRNLTIYIINSDTPFNKSFIKKIISLFTILTSVIKSYKILKIEKPNLVFGVGGYVSFPICIAAKILNIPIAIYENNVILGRANKYLLPFVRKFFSANHETINFPTKYKNKFFYVGHIVREEIQLIKNKKIKNNQSDKEISLLVLGGSQGADIFDKIIPEVIQKLFNENIKINLYQQCTKPNKQRLIDFYSLLKIKFDIFNFKENIVEILEKTDLAITRCGASTTAELAEAKIPFIAIPYLFAADNHQLLNAKFYEKSGCCWILEQQKLNKESLFNLIKLILKDKKNLDLKKENMNNFSSSRTLQQILHAIEETI